MIAGPTTDTPAHRLEYAAISLRIRCGALMLGALLALCLVAVCRPARACSVCGCDDPLVAVGDSSPNVGALRLALAFSAVTASARSDDDPQVTERLTRMTLSPTVVYSPLSGFNAVLSVPLLRNRYSASGRDEQISATLWGLGDAELSVRYFIWRDVDFAARRRQNVAISVGTSMPTGRTDATQNGARLDEHAQLGRGAFGPFVAALYAFHQDPWNLSLDATGRTFTTNHYDYRYGSAALWNVALQFRVLEPFVLHAGLNGRYAVRDRQAGEVQENTGGFVLQAVPGALFQIADGLWLQARVEIPFFKQLFGVQTLGPTYFAVVQWAPMAD
jgi:hypothetical protein